jgi:hypothetical protein
MNCWPLLVIIGHYWSLLVIVGYHSKLIHFGDWERDKQLWVPAVRLSQAACKSSWRFIGGLNSVTQLKTRAWKLLCFWGPPISSRIGLSDGQQNLSSSSTSLEAHVVHCHVTEWQCHDPSATEPLAPWCCWQVKICRLPCAENSSASELECSWLHWQVCWPFTADHDSSWTGPAAVPGCCHTHLRQRKWSAPLNPCCLSETGLSSAIFSLVEQYLQYLQQEFDQHTTMS